MHTIPGSLYEKYGRYQNCRCANTELHKLKLHYTCRADVEDHVDVFFGCKGNLSPEIGRQALLARTFVNGDGSLLSGGKLCEKMTFETSFSFCIYWLYVMLFEAFTHLRLASMIFNDQLLKDWLQPRLYKSWGTPIFFSQRKQSKWWIEKYRVRVRGLSARYSYFWMSQTIIYVKKAI